MGSPCENVDSNSDHHTVSYAYSARYLLNSFSVTDTASRLFLGMAPVVYKKEMNLAQLPGSDQSLQKIARYFPGSNELVFGEATKSKFLKTFSRYQIVQLYAHALDSSTNGGDPVIYFSDSALSLSSLVPESKALTRLVVLSACLTARGKAYRGEGIFSFNRGLLH